MRAHDWDGITQHAVVYLVVPRQGSEGRDGLLDAESTLEFHRLYSAIFFLTNMTEDDGEPQDQSVFGDGLRWGGCILVHVLGQQSRFNGARTATSAG